MWKNHEEETRKAIRRNSNEGDIGTHYKDSIIRAMEY